MTYDLDIWHAGSQPYKDQFTRWRTQVKVHGHRAQQLLGWSTFP